MLHRVLYPQVHENVIKKNESFYDDIVEFRAYGHALRLSVVGERT